MSPFDRLTKALGALPTEKRAGLSEPPTAHPVGDAPSGFETYEPGSRSAENEADAKKQNPRSPEALRGTTFGPAPSTTRGVTSSANGEDPSTEKGYGERLNEPPSAHPTASTGEKYSSWSTPELVAAFTKVANAILVEVAGGHVAAQPAAPVSADEAAQAGYKFAEFAIAQAHKQAVAANVIYDTQREADDDASNVIRFLQGYSKAAAEDPEGVADAAAAVADSSKTPDSVPTAASVESALEEAGAPATAPNADMVLQELAQAMMEQGITPAQLLALVSSGAPAAVPSMAPPVAAPMMVDPAMAAAPPDMKMASGLRKLASDRQFVTNLMHRVAEYQERHPEAQRLSRPKNATASAVRERMREFLQEVR